jgi:hypothetical protein
MFQMLIAEITWKVCSMQQHNYIPSNIKISDHEGEIFKSPLKDYLLCDFCSVQW